MKISYKHVKRYKEILRILVKYGFTFIVEKLNIENVAYRTPIKPISESIRNMSTGEKLRKALEELGPTFIKIGQILSARTDLLEPDIIEELSKLRYNVEVFDTEIAKQIFTEETGYKIEDIFLSFNEVPIAAASIGQVYECKLKNGDDVVLKIQRPNIENIIKADIEIMRKICESIDLSSLDISINLVKILEEFYMQLMRELDYNFEAMNAIKFKKMFNNSTTVHIPKIYDEFTTKKVLVIEKIIGVRLDDKKKISELNWNMNNISKVGMRAFFKQVLDFGFFHADLHPGNIFVVSQNCISYIDFGMVGIIDNETLLNINNLALAIIQKDIDKIIYILDEMKILNKKVDKSSLKQELLYMIHYYYDAKIESIDISDIINEIFVFLRKYKMTLPYELSILAKTIITLEGTARELNPNFSIKDIVKEFANDYYEQRFSAERIISDSSKNIQSLIFELKYIPKQINRILKSIENNNINVDIKEIDTNKLEKNISQASTKVALSLIIASLFMGSSMMISSPNIDNDIVRIIAFSGIAVSVLLGIMLTLKIIMNRK